MLAFGVGTGLVALAPMVRRLGNLQLGDSIGAEAKESAESSANMMNVTDK